MKAVNKLKKLSFKEDLMKAKDINSMTISYVYEEDDPQRMPNKKLGELMLDK